MTLFEKLSNLDWDFVASRSGKGLQDIHPYPAKFIPEIPRQIISEIGLKKGTAILDPFCGSGTTLMVAQSLGIPSVGIDLNPIACLISEVKTSPPINGLYDQAIKIVENAKNGIHSLEEVSYIPNLNHWFKKDIQKALLSLKNEINLIKNSKAKKALQLCLSSIMVRVSNQDSDTRYAAVENNIRHSDVYRLFLLAAGKLEKIKSNGNGSGESVKIFNKDVLSVKPQQIKEDIGLVITSPPYPNAYEYWLYHKYRMFWLDFDPLAVKEKEIGARAHFFKRNHHTEDDFFHQMSGTLSLVNDVLVKGGHAVFVVGRSKIHGKIVDNSEIIKNAAESNKLKLVGKITRTIKSSRKSFNLTHAKIKEEQIVILKK